MSMNQDSNQVIIRRRKRRNPRLSVEKRRILSTRLTFLILASVLIYGILTIWVPWTGFWGRALGDWLLDTLGGSVIIPFCLGIYLLFAAGTGRSISSLPRQCGGTLLLYLAGSIMMGLMSLSGMAFRPLAPGIVGTVLASGLCYWTGALGALFIGIAITVLSAVVYEITSISPDDLKRVVQKLTLKIRSRRFRRQRQVVQEDIPVSCDDKEESGQDVSHEEPLDDKLVDEPMAFSSTESEIPVDHSFPVERSFGAESWSMREYSPVRDKKRRLEDKELDYGASERIERFRDMTPMSDSSVPDQVQEDPEPVRPRRTRFYVSGRTEIPTKNQPASETSFKPRTSVSAPSQDRVVIEEKQYVEPAPADFPPLMDAFGPKDTGAMRNDPIILRQKGLDIVTALASFGVEASLAHTVEGPTVIQYQLQLAAGVKVSKVAGLSKDIAVALAVPSLRVEAPIQGTSYIGIEVPNRKRRSVTLRSVVESQEFSSAEVQLPLPLGFRVDGSPVVVGLEELPHLLVAGTTGSGKSVFVTSCITALCATRTPQELRFILVDPKRVEMAIFEHLPHILAKPVVDPQKAVHALGWAVREMDRRYEVFARAKTRNLSGYNAKVLPKDQLPHIVIVVDELADLMLTASKDVEEFICRLAQMARATGIHLILATQRPSVNVITGLIKANIPARAAFTLPSQTDSRTIIDVTGAQQLLGKGDMLFSSTKNPKPIRIQSPFIDEDTTLQVIDSLRRTFGDPEYVEIEDQQNGRNGGEMDFANDDRLEEAVELILKSGIASASRLQRQMRVGFTRAARMIDAMEMMGIIGPQDGAKPREIYVDEAQAQRILEEHFGR